MKYYLDTNTCIYALKNTFPGLNERLLQCSPGEVAIPSMVEAELLLGARKSTQPEKTATVLRHFLGPFSVVPFDSQAAAIYADIRAALEQCGQVMGPNDLVIAATVVARGGTLVTRNTKEFKRVARLRIENWCD